MKTLLSLWVLCAVILGRSTSAAQDIPELATDRPDETESSSVVTLGMVQIEAGGSYVNHQPIAGDEPNTLRSVAAPSVLVRYGVLDWLELRGVGEHTLEMRSVNDTESSSNLFAWGVGAKIRMLDESGWVPEMAFIGELAFPDGGDVIPGFRLAMSHTLAPSVGFGYNIGGEFDPDASSFIGIYTAALGVDITESLGGFIEAFGSVSGGDEWEHLVDGGFTYAVASNLQLDAAVGAGLSGNAPDYYLNAGISVRLPR